MRRGKIDRVIDSLTAALTLLLAIYIGLVTIKLLSGGSLSMNDLWGMLVISVPVILWRLIRIEESLSK